MGFLGSLRNLFGSRKESLEKKEEKLERKYGLKSGGAVR